MGFYVMIMTIFLMTRDDLMYANLTGISTLPRYHYIVVIHIILCAIYYAYHMHHIYHSLNSKHPFIHCCITLTMIIMIIGACSPYHINSNDLFSSIHVICSMSSCVSFLALLWIYNRYLSYEYPQIYLNIHQYYDYGLYFLGLMFVVFTRVNGYLEIMFTILVTVYLMVIEKLLKKEAQESKE